jgi:DNA-binding beta-propeller fold protein YncE
MERLLLLAMLLSGASAAPKKCETDTITFVGDRFPLADEFTTHWYNGIATTSHGAIYATPYNARRVLKIDTEHDTTTLIGPDLGRKKSKYRGGVWVEDNHSVYMLPCGAPSVLRVDADTDEVTTFPAFEDATLKWHHGVYDPNTRAVFGIPYGAQHVLRIAIDTDTVTLFGKDLVWDASYPSTPSGVIEEEHFTEQQIKVRERKQLKNRSRFIRGVYSEATGLIFAVPYNAGEFLLIRPDNSLDDGAELFGFGRDVMMPEFTDPEQQHRHGYGQLHFVDAVTDSVGKIYCIPYNTDGVTVINPEAVARQLEADASGASLALGGAMEVLKVKDPKHNMIGKSKWSSGVFDPVSGHIYGIPYAHSSVLKIDTTTHEVTTFGYVGEHRVDAFKWLTGIYSPESQAIYAVPQRSHEFLRIDTHNSTAIAFGHEEVGSFGEYKYMHAVRCPVNGGIYAIPAVRDQVVKICPGDRHSGEHNKHVHSDREFLYETARSQRRAAAASQREL